MADQNQQSLITEGVDIWNKWREEHPEAKINLYRANLSGLNLTGANFTDTELEAADLSGANLTGANFQNANLSKAVFTGAIFIKTTFYNAKLNYVVLSNVDLTTCSFSKAQLYKINFEKANLTKVSFYQADARYANLKNANLLGTAFSESNFEFADFTGADLSDAIFEKAYLPDTNFSGAKIDRTDFIEANLSGATFTGADLTTNLERENLTGHSLLTIAKTRFRKANLRNAKLNNANATESLFSYADLENADLSNAHLFGAWMDNCNLINANLSGANLSNANLTGAILTRANLSEANLDNANLSESILIQTNIQDATLTRCKIFGVSAWSLKGNPKQQASLVITPNNESEITVDDLQVAQFIYLLLNRENLRNVLETITTKAVLILGRFSPERKIILDAIAEELRNHNLLPIIFDFERATSRDFTETIKILAGMSLFVIADITNPKSAPLELQATIPDYEIPFVPIIQTGEKQFSMFDDLRKYGWVLPLLQYSSLETLRLVFKDLILERAIEKHKELQNRKALKIQALSADEYLKQKMI